MGFSLNWFAFADLSVPAAAKVFGLESTNVIDDSYDFRFGGAITEKDWTIIAFNRTKGNDPSEEGMHSYSIGRKVLSVQVEEHVMVQVATLWEDGREIWRISHDSQKDGRNLESRGLLPSFYGEICARRQKEQDEEDAGEAQCDFICEIPLEVAARLTGFKHDETDLAFTVLTNGKVDVQKPRSFLHRLFGK